MGFLSRCVVFSIPKSNVSPVMVRVSENMTKLRAWRSWVGPKSVADVLIEDKEKRIGRNKEQSHVTWDRCEYTDPDNDGRWPQANHCLRPWRLQQPPRARVQNLKMSFSLACRKSRPCFHIRPQSLKSASGGCLELACSGTLLSSQQVKRHAHP